MGHLQDQLRTKIYILKDENRRLKRHLKRVRKMREAIAKWLIFYQDFINTKVLEFDEKMEEVQQQIDQIQRAFHQDSHISFSKDHRKTKSF